MTKSVLVFAILFTLAGCCDPSSKRIPAHFFSVLEGLSLAPVAVTRESAIGVIKVPFHEEHFIGRFEDLGIRWIFSQANYPYGFWFELENNGDGEIRLLWPESRYVDELGAEHEIFSQSRGPLPEDPRGLKPPPRQVVRAGERVEPTVLPIFKQYLVSSGCRETIPYSEPLIPTNLAHQSETQARERVRSILRNRIPVKLKLPIEANGDRYVYIFEFVLRER